MKRIILIIMIFAMTLYSLQIQAEGSSIKVEFSGTSMTIELSQQPKIVTEDGKLVLKTNSMSVAFTLDED
jgi:hypothetical protein